MLNNITVDGGGGNDTIVAGAGVDGIAGGGGNDLAVFTDALFNAIVDGGAAGSSWLNGGAGHGFG